MAGKSAEKLTSDDKTLLTRIDQLTEQTSKQQKEIEALKKTIKAQETKINKYEASIQVKLDDRHKELNAAVKTLTEKIKQFENQDILKQDHIKQFEENVIKEIEGLKNSVNTNMPTTKPKTFASLFPSNKATILYTLNKEKHDQDIRKNNLIISGIPLPDDITTILAHDTEVVNEIANDLNITMPLADIKIKRLGKIDEQKRQKILITLPNELRDSLLKKARYLRQLNRWDNVYISPDLTRDQQQVQYLLRCELRKKRIDEPDRKWMIYNNQIKEFKTRPNTPVELLPNTGPINNDQ